MIMSFRIYESEVYKEFRDLKNEDPFLHEDDFYDVREILTFLAANLRRAANRGDAAQKIEVDLDYVYDVGASQDFLCALTGDELEFTRGGQNWLGKWCNPNSCTIDRIDSSKGYVEGNIQLITWRANCLKQNMNNDEFIEFCKDVARWNK
jgi:hypothetical protein